MEIVILKFNFNFLQKKNQIRIILRNFGLVVITREGSNPHKFIYESDLLSENSVSILTVIDLLNRKRKSLFFNYNLQSLLLSSRIFISLMNGFQTISVQRKFVELFAEMNRLSIYFLIRLSIISHRTSCINFKM